MPADGRTFHPARASVHPNSDGLGDRNMILIANPMVALAALHVLLWLESSASTRPWHFLQCHIRSSTLATAMATGDSWKRPSAKTEEAAR